MVADNRALLVYPRTTAEKMESKIRHRGSLGPAYGKGTHTIAAETLPSTPAQLLQSLLQHFKSPSYQPPRLPHVATELMQLTRKANVEIRNVLALLERDSFLASRVLSVAESPLFRRQVSVRSLQEAVVRLGMGTVRDIAMEAALRITVFRVPGYEERMGELQKHSQATAHLARLICRHTAIFDEYAFLCGLLHDVGVAASLIVLGDVSRGQVRPPLESVWPTVLDAHEIASQRLAEIWKLPADVALVLGSHHKLSVQGVVHPLAAAIHIADALAAELGRGIPDDVARNQPQARSVLQLSEGTMAVIRSEAQKTLETID